MKSIFASGSYYRNDVSGLGADDRALPFADQTLLGIIQAQPSLVYTEWAEQTGDASWSENSAPVDYKAYAIADQQLVATVSVATAAPAALAVLSPVLTRPDAVRVAFEGTPYAYEKTEAVYAQADSGNPPTIYFLYWISIRSATDPKTGSTSLNATAAALGGVLSYILEIPRAATDRAPPGVSFLQALALQMQKGPVVVPPTPAVQQTTPAPGVPAPAPVTPAPSSAPISPPVAHAASPNLKALFWVGLGTAAALGAYHVVMTRWEKAHG